MCCRLCTLQTLFQHIILSRFFNLDIEILTYKIHKLPRNPLIARQNFEHCPYNHLISYRIILGSNPLHAVNAIIIKCTYMYNCQHLDVAPPVPSFRFFQQQKLFMPLYCQKHAEISEIKGLQFIKLAISYFISEHCSLIPYQ